MVGIDEPVQNRFPSTVSRPPAQALRCYSRYLFCTRSCAVVLSRSGSRCMNERVNYSQTVLSLCDVGELRTNTTPTLSAVLFSDGFYVVNLTNI